MKRITPILTVDAIEPVLPFWTDGIGFEITARVPHPPDAEDGPLGFVILKLGDVEIMLQSRESVVADLGGTEGADADAILRALDGGGTMLFAQVDSVDPVLERLDGPRVAVPRRTTFYGMDEIFLWTPGGTLLGLAAPVETHG